MLHYAILYKHDDAFYIILKHIFVMIGLILEYWVLCVGMSYKSIGWQGSKKLIYHKYSLHLPY